jgi:hypothetical protein
MTAEETNYKLNNRAFIDKLQNAFMERIILSLDTEPAFNITTVPFKFDYSLFVTLITSKGNYTVITSATSDGMETFWIEEVKKVPEGNKVTEIDSLLKGIQFEVMKGFKYPFKVSLQLGTRDLFLYCGEIYDNIDGTLRYTFNDEMLLVFDSVQEAMKLERLFSACTEA